MHTCVTTVQKLVITTQKQAKQKQKKQARRGMREKEGKKYVMHALLGRGKGVAITFIKEIRSAYYAFYYHQNKEKEEEEKILAQD